MTPTPSPKLPEPCGDIRLPGHPGLACDGYSADQMLAYRDACLAAQAERHAEEHKARTVFYRMCDGHYASFEAEDAIEEILGVDLLGISFDDYDSSFEIYPLNADDVVLSSEQHAAILALGCNRYWINFKDGTERYSNGDRKAAAGSSRWASHNAFKERKRSEEAEVKRLREALTSVLRHFPTDTDLMEAGWTPREVEEACSVHDAARAALTPTNARVPRSAT